MVLEISDDPDTAVNEQQHAGFGGGALRRHDVELHSLTILVDRLLDGGHSGQIDRRLVLQRGEYLLRFGLWQLPEWTAVLVEFGQESADLGIDVRVRRRI